MPDIDPTVSRRTQAGIAIGGGVLALGAVGALVYLGYKAIKGLGDGLAGLGQGAKELADGTGAVIGGVGTIGSVIGGGLHGAPGYSTIAPKEFDTKKGDLLLREWQKGYDKTSKGQMHNTVFLEVLDDATKKPIRGALVKGVPNFGATAALPTFKRVEQFTDSLGRVRFDWTVGDVPGINHEDDITFVASMTGYNSSQPFTKS